MLWQQAWRRAALAVLLFGPTLHKLCIGFEATTYIEARGWDRQRKLEARESTRDLWNHGYTNYMRYAFPLDELMPLSCAGRGPDWDNPHNFGNNDVAGNFSLTLIDVLDTFIVLDDREGFNDAVRKVTEWVSFDVNTRPQVFETTIRVLGGLLSAHIFASNSNHTFYLPWYRGELLNLAQDLGERMLPAFLTPTGIPYARLNLRHGVPYGESLETCTAGAGSLILEFGTLSRLTGDVRFEEAAHKAFFALWNRKTDISLVGNTINTWTGKWISPEVTGIGAGIDSFFEYAFKWYILSGEMEFLDVWHEAYAAIMRYSRAVDGFWFRNVNIHSGDVAFSTADSLSAFWPGLQVLAGDVESAIKSHLIFWNLWKRCSGLPEVWDINQMQALALQYPLRPEFVESTYYLYRATGDTFYLDVGERILHDLTTRAKVECGLTSISDLRTNKRDDRMESFVLSETLKYLFLLFDEDNALHKDDSNFVFTTEGHILSLDKKHLKPMSAVRRKLRKAENLQCPAYNTPLLKHNERDQGLPSGIHFRPDIDYARVLVGADDTDEDETWWTTEGRCEVPVPQFYSYDFILSVNGKGVSEDKSPGPRKLVQVDDGFILQNISGIRAHIVNRLDGKGFDIVKLGPHNVLRGQLVYINDTDLYAPIVYDSVTQERLPEIPLHISLDGDDQVLQGVIGVVADLDLDIMAQTALFGGDPTLNLVSDESHVRFGRGQGSRLVQPQGNVYGCESFSPDSIPLDSVVLIHRGDCTFYQKLLNIAAVGASGAIVISDDDILINPSADREDIGSTVLEDAVLLVVTKFVGHEIQRLMDIADEETGLQVTVTVDPEGLHGVTQMYREARNDDRSARQTAREQGKILYLNGHPVLNTRLIL